MLGNTRDQLEAQLTDDATTIGQIEATPVAGSTITSSPAVPLGSGATLVWTVSGAMLGLLLAVIIAFLRDAIGPRVGNRNRARSVAGVWVLARMMREVDRSSDSDAGSHQIVGAVDVLASVGVALVVGVDEDVGDRARRVGLNRTLINISREGWPDDRIALLAGPRTRLRHIVQARRRLELRGAFGDGLILRGQRERRFSRLRSRREPYRSHTGRRTRDAEELTRTMEPLSPDSAPTFYVMRTLRRHWRLIVLVAIVFAAGAGVYELLAPTTYSSNATVQVKPLVGNAFSPDTASNANVALETEAQLVGITDRTLLTNAARIDTASNPSHAPAAIAAVTKPLDTIQHWSCTRSSVAAAVLTNAFLIQVTYTSHNAATAETCAQSFAQAFLNYRHALAVQTQNTQATNLNGAANHTAAKLEAARSLPASNPTRAALINQYELQLTSLQTQIAQVLSLPTSPGTFLVSAGAAKSSGVKPILVVAGAGVLGLVVGVLLALARGRRDRRILTETNERNLGLPVLASVVTGRKVPIGTPLPDLASDEAFRIAAISVLAGADAHTAIAVSPLSSEESSAGVSIRLARGIAAAGYSVVLVDAVTDGPQVGKLLDMEPQSGLSDIIDGAGLDTVNVIDFDGLEVLAAGTDPAGSRQRYAGGRDPRPAGRAQAGDRLRGDQHVRDHLSRRLGRAAGCRARGRGGRRSQHHLRGRHRGQDASRPARREPARPRGFADCARQHVADAARPCAPGEGTRCRRDQAAAGRAARDHRLDRPQARPDADQVLSVDKRPGPAEHYLREVTQLLWPDSTLARGSNRRNARYVVIPSASRPKLIVPRRPLRLAGAAVRNYNTGSTSRERLAITALAAAVRAGFGELLPSRLDDRASTSDIRTRLSEVLARPVEVGLYIGPARAVRKPVVQVLDRRGETVAFAKVGVDEFTRALVRGEAATLAGLATAPLDILVIPDVLHHGQWNTHELLVLRAMRRGAPAPAGDALLARAMDELARAHRVDCEPVRTSRYRQELEQRLQAVSADPVAAHLLDSLELLDARLGDVPLEVGAWHGDWTPWNMTVADGRVYVWDWEKFETGKPIGFDAIHYTLHWTISIDGVSAHEAFASSLQRIDEVLQAHGISGDHAVAVFWLYVLELAVRYLEDDEMNAGTTTLSRMTEWLPNVLDLVEQHTAPARTGSS